jgi:hypothetical protein
MSKRYYLCDVIGDGTEYNPFRPAVADANVSWVGDIPVDLQTGQPLYAWALVLVATDKHQSLRSDSRINALPDFPLDGRMNAINNAAAAGLTTALQKRGISVNWGGTAGYRDVLQEVGRRNNANFNIDNFDVAE